MKPTPIGHLLGRSLDRHKIGREVTAARVVAATEKILDLVFERPMRDYARPISFDRGTLRIACVSSVVTEAVRQHQSDIFDHLRREFPGLRLERIAAGQSSSIDQPSE